MGSRGLLVVIAALAALSLGLRPWQATRLVLLPQALRVVLPSLVSIAVSAYFVVDIFALSAAVGGDHPQLGIYVAFGTVARVAERSGTSGASVVRLATRLGFPGFSGLQAAVQAASSRACASPSVSPAPKNAGDEPIPPKLPQPRITRETIAPPPQLRREELCRISYQRPVEGCQTYIEYFKDDDEIPTRLCPIHEGSLKQKAQRALQEVFGAIGRGIRGIFEN